MTTAFLILDLERDEGFRSTAYPDPISHGEPWTIGYGDTHGVTEGMTTTQGEALAKLATNIKGVCDQLDAELPWWRTLSDLRQDVLANMAFNMGVEKLLTFNTLLGLVKAGDFAGAAADMLTTLWAREVGNRAVRLSRQMASNVHQSLPA